MKVLIVFSLLFAVSNSFAKGDLAALQKKHRAALHEEKKKWSKMEKECDSKYPKRSDESHPDYDAYFKCNEAVKDAEQAFEVKYNAELCTEVGISCSPR